MQRPLPHLSVPPHLFAFNEEVRKAIETDGGTSQIVALESTIISHGMPYPENVKCANDLEQIVRDSGAVPATIAILEGVVHIGLSASEVEMLGKEGAKCMKCSRRDIPFVLAGKRHGATTVAATILLANMVGIKVMATGGIGGVHRGGEVSMDVSADLTELGRTQVLVVCAGAKSILDIPRTLEVLETQGVPVIGYGTNEFPAFFTRKSGCMVHLSMNSADEVALFTLRLNEMQMGNGAVLAVPIPIEMEADGAKIEEATAQAVDEANKKSIIGRDVTPYILKRVNEITGGNSLRSNLALVKNNARAAAEIAARLRQLYCARE